MQCASFEALVLLFGCENADAESYHLREFDGMNHVFYRIRAVDEALVEVDSFDSDGDGLPDVWELQYFSDATGAASTFDADLDGLNSLEEFIAGTNPTNPASFCRCGIR